jgi:hypothetical protein
MHFCGELEDGTIMGLYDGTRGEGAISESAFWNHHEEVARREHPITRGHRISAKLGEWPSRAIEHARVRTALVSTYRVHSRQYFSGSVDFPKIWAPREIKSRAPERFSPAGTIGYYFGLTVDAALDEAAYYGARSGDADISKDSSKLLLVHRTYYHDLLYLAPVLDAVWAHLSLPSMNVWDMYVAIMDPRTTNTFTDTIGRWAREAGFAGIVYPSARFGQRLDPAAGSMPSARFPVLNFVEIGSHLCEQGIGISSTLSVLASELATLNSDQPPPLVYSEPNLVIFDEAAVAGRDRPVFYQTYEMREADVLRELDERQTLKSQILYRYDAEEITLFVQHPKYKHLVQAPRRPRFPA